MSLPVNRSIPVIEYTAVIFFMSYLTFLLLLKRRYRYYSNKHPQALQFTSRKNDILETKWGQFHQTDQEKTATTHTKKYWPQWKSLIHFSGQFNFDFPSTEEIYITR